jgi:major membrane immunogen (membrane-anchored lipoprotein)
MAGLRVRRLGGAVAAAFLLVGCGTQHATDGTASEGIFAGAE